MAFLGELGLDGSLRGVPGTVVLAEALEGYWLVVPPDCADEAVLAGPAGVRTAPTLGLLVDRLAGRRPWSGGPGASRTETGAAPARPPGSRRVDRPVPDHGMQPEGWDLADVRGQWLARRAVEGVATGGHHVLLVGPPGSGKTLVARCLPGLLPDLDRPTALKVTRIQSVAGLGLPPGGLAGRPPFRSPHRGA